MQGRPSPKEVALSHVGWAGMLLLDAGQWGEAEGCFFATVKDKKNDPYGWLALGVMHLRRWQQEPKVCAELKSQPSNASCKAGLSDSVEAMCFILL